VDAGAAALDDALSYPAFCLQAESASSEAAAIATVIVLCIEDLPMCGSLPAAPDAFRRCDPTR
jgi:hypothetical protein